MVLVLRRRPRLGVFLGAVWFLNGSLRRGRQVKPAANNFEDEDDDEYDRRANRPLLAPAFIASAIPPEVQSPVSTHHLLQSVKRTQ